MLLATSKGFSGPLFSINLNLRLVMIDRQFPPTARDECGGEWSDYPFNMLKIF